MKYKILKEVEIEVSEEEFFKQLRDKFITSEALTYKIGDIVECSDGRIGVVSEVTLSFVGLGFLQGDRHSLNYSTVYYDDIEELNNPRIVKVLSRI